MIFCSVHNWKQGWINVVCSIRAIRLAEVIDKFKHYFWQWVSPCHSSRRKVSCLSANVFCYRICWSRFNLFPAIYILHCLSIFNCFSSICIWKLIRFSSTNDKDSSLQPINYAFSKSARFKQAERGFPSSILSTFYSSFGVLHYADIRQRNGNSAFQ